jgi:hypothetical protein
MVNFMKWLLSLGLLMGLAVHGHTATLQYDIATLRVLGAFETENDTRPLDGSALLEVSGNLASIVWPVPSGCVSGRKEWSILSPGGVEPLLVDPSLAFFSTTSSLLSGCFLLSSAPQLWALVNMTLERALATGNPLTTVSGKLNVAALGICPPSDVSSDCVTLRANMVTWNDVPVGAAVAMHFFMVEAQLLKGDAVAFITAQGW